MQAHITVHLKPGISDPEAQNALKAMHLLGFDAVTEVHTVKTWVVHLDTKSKPQAKKQAEEITRRLLTNPVIHDATVELV